MKVTEMDMLLERLRETEAAYAEVLAACQAGGPEMIRAWRLARGWTQWRMADEIGIARSYVSRLEGGSMPLSRQVLRAMYEAGPPSKG